MKTKGLGLIVLIISIVHCQGDNEQCNAQPWSALLETWATERQGNSARSSRVMKFGDKSVTVKGPMANKREVSETDLYLLGAIEKLLYRVDRLEKRVLRAEELLYYMISGNNTDQNPCPVNYTKIKKQCYYFSSRDYDWKSSASLCRSLGGNLVEFKTADEKRAIDEHLKRDKFLRGYDYWTGALNPGLLWIWSGSAEQVQEDKDEPIEEGNGRCLKLHYKLATGSYFYYGEECIRKLRYICKSILEESNNIIEKSARALFQKKKNNL